MLLPGDPARVALIAAGWAEAREIAVEREHVTFTGTLRDVSERDATRRELELSRKCLSLREPEGAQQKGAFATLESVLGAIDVHL